MSSSFHLETDGASEQSNKTVNQSICYHVDRAQKGWVAALPRIHFNMMNTINASTGFSSFNLHLGHSPQVIPPLIPKAFTPGIPQEDIRAAELIEKLLLDTQTAADNLIRAKVDQAHQANCHRSADFCPIVGDRVLLNMFHRHRDYAQGGSGRVAKFMPHYDGPYLVTHANPDLLSYTLDIPNSPARFNTFHISELRKFIPNDKDLFPSCDHPSPGPVVTEEGLEEHVIEHILDEQRRGRGFQYLIRWLGFSESHDEWLPHHQLEDCEALDVWIEKKADEMKLTDKVTTKSSRETCALLRVGESVSLTPDLQPHAAATDGL